MNAGHERDTTLRTLEGELGALIRRVRRALNDRALMVHPDLPAVSYSMLSALNDQGPQRASTLADTFFVDKGAVSRQVAQMETLGLLERAPDPDDGRASILTVTAEGTRRLAEVKRIRQERFDRRLADWSDAELAQLTSLVTRYNRSLSAPEP